MRQLAVACIVMLVTHGGCARLQGEPSHDGKPLSHWMRALTTGDAADGAEAAQAITSIGPPALPVLIDALARDDDPLRRRMVMAVLTEMGTDAKPAVPSLMKLLTNEASTVRVPAAIALSRIDADLVGKCLPVLVEGLKLEPQTAEESLHAIARLRENAKPAVPAVVEALTRKELDVRLLAAYALGRIGPEARAAVPALQAALSDEDGRVRQNATAALKSIEGK
jgi:HEAT repeat protein